MSAETLVLRLNENDTLTSDSPLEWLQCCPFNELLFGSKGPLVWRSDRCRSPAPNIFEVALNSSRANEAMMAMNKPLF